MYIGYIVHKTTTHGYSIENTERCCWLTTLD